MNWLKNGPMRLLLLAFGTALVVANAPCAVGVSGSSGTSTTTVVVDQVQAEKTRKETEKLDVEIKKLRAEIESLQLENQALSVETRKWSAIVGAVGGVTGAFLTFLIGYAGLRLSRAQEARRSQDKHLTEAKLDQEKALAREKQTLEVYRDLGHSNPRTQIAAASLLLQRLESFRRKQTAGQPIDALEELERPTIIKVLVSVLKEREAIGQGFDALRKYIADGLVKVIGAPLKEFDWQNTNLSRVWWQGIDASGVDFYQANLAEAGFAGTNLQKAIFYEANLQNAVLKEARLAGANFFGAVLEGTNLRNATFDDETKWPQGFDPEAHGARREKSQHP